MRIAVGLTNLLLSGLLIWGTVGQAPAFSDSNNSGFSRVVNAKLMTPFADGQFHPERGVNRADLATILVKAFALNKRDITKEADFQIPDVPSTFWAYPSIQIALKTNTMREYHADEKFYPNQQITRSEGFAILAQAYGVFQFAPDTLQEIFSDYSDADKIPAWAKKAMATALHEGFVNTSGSVPGKIQIHPMAPLTRGDLAYALTKYLDRQEINESPWNPN